MPNQTWRGAELDPNGCLSLSTILRSFSAPITEEQAWAIAYQALKCLQNCLNSCHQLLLTSDPAHLLMHSEGFVHHLTFQQPKLQNGAAISRQARQRGNLKSENKAIADLAIVVYAALDYGLNPNEQRSLSMDMEDILEKMTSADERQSDDEGIEQDQAEDDDEDDNNGHDQIQHRRPRIKISGMCAIMLEKCGNHLSATSEAEDHFRNVCRALVSESLELSTFMLKVSEFDEDRASELKELDMQDWARLWVQCIRDLRHGVKLKKTNYSKTPVEFEMTPYEILMDDIRSRRYKLNKIMVDGEIPQMVKKDAHNIILEFIRSRPPLRPASKRAIQPTRRESTPVELLMESIRNSKARSSLRKTAGPKPRRKFMSVHESSRTFIQDDDVANGPKTRFNTLGSQDKPDGHHTTRKMIRVDQNDMDELLNFSGDETDIESMGGLSRQVSRDSSVSNRDLRMMNGDKHSKDKPDVPQRNDISRVAKDLAMYGKSEEMDQRRHSVSVCETPVKMRTTNPRRQKLFIKADSRSSTSISSSNATTPSSSGRATPIFGAHTNESLAAPSGEETFLSPSYGLNTAQMHANLQSEFLQSVSQHSDKDSTMKDAPIKKPTRIKSLRQPKLQVKPLKDLATKPPPVGSSVPNVSLAAGNGKRRLGDKVAIPVVRKKPIFEVKPKTPIVAKPKNGPRGTRITKPTHKEPIKDKIEDEISVDKNVPEKKRPTLKERLLAKRGAEGNEIPNFDAPISKSDGKELALIQATMMIRGLQKGQSLCVASSTLERNDVQKLTDNSPGNPHLLTKSTSLNGLSPSKTEMNPNLMPSKSLTCVKTKLFQNLQASSKDKAINSSSSSLVITTTFESIPEDVEEDSSDSDRYPLERSVTHEPQNSSTTSSEETLIGPPINVLNNTIELCIINERLKGLLKSLVPSWNDDNLEPFCTIKQWTKEHWAAALETLDLNLDELVHIRSVLTKAELESLPLDGTFKEDVEKGKMRIPLEHFSSIPSFALSPKVMSSLGPENQVSSTSPNPTCLSSEAKPQKKPIRTKSFVQTIRNRVSSNLPSLRNSAGSAPTSPEMGRKSSSGPPAHFRDQIHAYGSLNYLNVPEEDEYEGSGSASLPANVLEGTKRVGSKKSKEESLQGAMLQVCSDCREMVLQVIRAQRTAKRFQMTKMMFANAPKSTMYAKDEIF
eukprot:TCALIF_12532-PA protein Name:"Similar to spir Protein spire (Drosophila melanogaster)" AED:0.16 eAED:0.16 QI:480/0.81/0.75/1/0.90/0.91/12/178/1180